MDLPGKRLLRFSLIIAVRFVANECTFTSSVIRWMSAATNIHNCFCCLNDIVMKIVIVIITIAQKQTAIVVICRRGKTFCGGRDSGIVQGLRRCRVAGGCGNRRRNHRNRHRCSRWTGQDRRAWQSIRRRRGRHLTSMTMKLRLQ